MLHCAASQIAEILTGLWQAVFFIVTVHYILLY